MSKIIELGTSKILGIPYTPFEPTLEEAFKDTAKCFERYNDSGILQILRYIINSEPGKLYIIGGSKFHTMLQNMQAMEKVTICTVEDALDILLEKKHYILLDNDEYIHGVGADLQSIIHCRPPNMLCFQHLCVLALHLERILKIAGIINREAERDRKKVIFISYCYEEYILADLLYLLCRSVDSVVKYHSPTHRFHYIDSPFSQEEIVKDTHVIAVWNRNDVNLQCHKAFLEKVRDCDFYFFHGEKAMKSNATLLHDPVILWGYPCAGSGRIESTFAHIMPGFGVYYYVRGIIGSLQYDACREFVGSGRKRKPDNYIFGGDIIDLYNVLPLSSIIALHKSHYDVERILAATNGKMVIITRDYRDVLLSAINWLFGGLVYVRRRSRKEILMEVMANGIRDLFPPLDEATKVLVRLLGHKQVYFIKFENINEDPVKAYTDLFTWLGLRDDPLYDAAQVERLLPEIAAKVHPANQPIHQADKKRVEQRGGERLYSGISGNWKNEFDDEVKRYFKKHSNDILQCFGYEADDNW